jgi:hypothetical protein
MAKLKEEFFKILPPTIYFFVALHLVMFIRVLMLEGTGLSPYSSASIAVTALVLGKAVLLADMLPLINRFPNKPLIYNIAWKTVIYLLLSAVLHYLERLIDFWRETGSFVAGNEKAALGNHLAAFLRYSDPFIRTHRHVLHSARTGARDWEGKGAEDILRTDACAGSVMACFRTGEKYSVKKRLSESLKNR